MAKNGQMKIEKGIPIPEAGHYKTGKTSILRQLAIGECVLLPGNTSTNTSIAYAAIGRGKFVVRTEDNGTRVWRTK